jgi:hypothetical protein
LNSVSLTQRHPDPLIEAKRLQAVALRAQADALDLEAKALEGKASVGQDEWITRDNCAARYGVRFRVLHEAAKRGELPLFKVGRKPAAKRAHVEAWIASRPVAIAPPQPGADADAEYERLVSATARQRRAA